MIAYKSEQKDTAWQYGATVNGVTYGSADSLFAGNTTFNQPVTIGNRITSCAYMFNRCTNFNQPVTIPSSVTNCYDMFSDCTSFNQPITIPSSVTSCGSMFSNCTSFNQPVTIPSSVTSGLIFYKCTNFNSPVSFDSSFSSMNVFYNCSNMGSNIYFRGTTHANKYVLFGYMQANAIRKNIHFNSALNADFNGDSYKNSIVGADITWTAMTNGFYNAAYNIYCYYNYTG